MSGSFRSSAWDPINIVAQILTMQFLYYVSLGLWIIVVDLLCASDRSLDQIFDYQAVQFKENHGRLLMAAFIINSLIGAVGLWYIIKRTKLCLDFSATVFLFHLIFCWSYSHSFPSSLAWWLINIISLIIMTVVGEFLCMRTEMKAIPLIGVARADL